MFALSRGKRGRLAVAALVFIAAGVETMPLRVRSESGSAAAVARNPVARAPATAFVAVMPRRDPFAGGALSVARPVAVSAAPLGAMLAAGPVPVIPPAPPLIVPARVTAIVTGARSFALVEDAGSTRVVTAGESLSGERIVAIRTDGVHLANGDDARRHPEHCTTNGSSIT